MSNSQTKRFDKKESQFLEAISARHIDIKNLRGLSATGIVDSCGIRALCWRIFLNVLPVKHSEWQSTLEKQRKQYKDFLNEVIIEPGLKRCDAVVDDHPLNPNPNSEWNHYFQDNTVLLQIDKDVRRLCPDISFFQSATEYPCNDIVAPETQLENLRKRVERSVLNSESLTKNRSGIANLISGRKKASREYDVIMEEGQEAHWEVVERILFIYAKLNPGTGYVQGMNELIGPLYFTLASDPNKEWKVMIQKTRGLLKHQNCSCGQSESMFDEALLSRSLTLLISLLTEEHSEADAFFCFTNLMGEVRDHFIKSLDKSFSGIEFSMNRVTTLLKRCDPQIHNLLETQKIRPQYYLFRWITLLLSQEFSLPDVIVIWDVLFSDPHRFDFLICVCAAMIILVRGELFNQDFGYNLKLLQNYPERIDVYSIISKARELRCHMS